MYFFYYIILKAWFLKVLAINILKFLKRRFIVLRMDLSNQCNLKCKMCYMSGQEKTDRIQLDKEQIDKIAQKLFPKVRILYLSCAYEVFSGKELDYALEMANKFKVPNISLVLY